ncbi:MAG TPA: RHS repeat-associated core domain-containing protein [Candidatus Obscuribacterales bacterium]
MQAINVSATSSANVVTIVSHSSRITTYSKTVTAAPAPETLALSSMSNVTNYGYNPANQLLTISAPGTARFQGSASKALKSAAVQTQVVSLTPSTVPVPTYSTNVGDTTVIMTLGKDYKNGYRSVVLTGGPYSASAGKDVSITVKHPVLPGGQTAVNYVVQSGDTLASIAAGLASAINGTSALQAIGVSASSTANATLPWSQQFQANALLPAGTSQAKVSATDGLNNTVTNNHHLTVTGPNGKQLTYDANGNMTSDGERAYLWDAQNRLYRIVYPSNYFGDFTEFVYDGLDRCVKIIEYTNFAATSTKQFVWCANRKCEERDGSGAVSRKLFNRGIVVGTTANFYLKDHLTSIRELTDSSGNVVTQYSYEPYGQAVSLQGSTPADFQYGGYYLHSRSGLYLTLNRAYSAWLGIWLRRDPLGENEQTNLYSYVGCNPISNTDPLGLQSGMANNCLGYVLGGNRTAETPYGTYADPGSSSMGDWLRRQGWNCTLLASPNDKKAKQKDKECKPNKCEDTFILIFHHPTLPNVDWMQSCTGGAIANDAVGVHAVGYDVGVFAGAKSISGWSEIHERVDASTEPSGPLDDPYYKNDNSVVSRYCCRKKK